MDEVYKELGEVKAELEKLKEDCRIKTELSESLRKAHADQQAKCQEAKLKIEKQENELNVKSDEIGGLRQLYEEVKLKLHETETSLTKVTSVNEKLRFDTGEKVLSLEEENKKLVSSLEETTVRNDNLEQKLQTCSEEIAGLKGHLLELQRKCSEAEEKVQAGKELRHREDVIMKLEEQSMSVQDQLKWKKEQFQHLEAAHRNLQDQFQLSKKECESEKLAMLGEMAILQSKLDSHIRIKESLESRLKMCNQALAHEESRRKLLEVQLSESKQCFENVLAEYEEAKEKIEILITKRDEDIAGLRNSLGMKEALLKDMNYKATYLEQENIELLGTVKELQEAQINRRKVDPSIPKLKKKLKDLEQEHSKCFQTLEEKEVEWNSKMNKLIDSMKFYETDAKRQNELMQRLTTELDHCHSEIEVSGEETSILFMVLKSELSDVFAKLYNLEAQTDGFSEENANNAPLKDEGCLKHAQVEIASLTKKLKSLTLLEKRGKMLEDALEEHKKMLEESSESQLSLKEQVTQMEVDLRKVSTALEKSNNALTVKISEVSQAEAELLLWKSKAESFRTCLEQCQEVCKKLEISILEQVEIEKGLRKENEISQCNLKEQEQRINDLQQNIASLNQILEQKDAMTEETKLESAKALKNERQRINDLQQKIDSSNKILEEKEAMAEETKFELAKALKNEEYVLQLLIEKDTMVESLQKELKNADNAKLEVQNNFQSDKAALCKMTTEKSLAIENLGKELEVLKQESVKNESARLEAEIRFESEKEETSRVISEKGETIRRVQEFVSSLEKDMDKLFFFVLCKDVENLVEMISLQEYLEKTESYIKSEMEKKKNAIEVLEVEVNNLHNKMLLQDGNLVHSNKLIQELEALAEANKLAMEKLTQEYEADQDKLKEVVKELENKNKTATNNITSLSSEKESLLTFIEGVCEQFGHLCKQDVELDGMLVKMIQNGNDYTFTSNEVIPGKGSASVQKHVRKEVEPGLDRSPLRERNQ